MLKLSKILGFFVLYFPFLLFASQSTIDSLKNELKSLDGFEKAKLESALAKEYDLKEEYNNSLKYNKEALLYYLENRLEDEIFETYIVIGSAYSNMDINNLALENYFKAKQISEKTNNLEQKAKVTQHIGIVYVEMGRYKEAINDYLLKSLLLFEQLDLKENLASCLLHIGIAHGEMGDLDSSLIYFNKSLELVQQLNDSYLITYTLGNMGYAYFLLEQYEEALVQTHKALKIGKQINHKSSIGNSALVLSEIYSAKKDIDKALEYCELALSISNQTQQMNLKINSNKQLSDIYYSKKEFKKSRDYFEKYAELEANMHSKISEKRISDLLVSFENEKNEKKLLQLNTEKRLQDLKIENQKKWLFATLFVLLVVLSLLLYIVLQKRSLYAANENLVRKNLEILEVEKLDKELESYNRTEQKFSKEASDSIRYTGSILNPEQKDQILNAIREEFEKNKVYLQQDITLSKLSELIGSNNAYISQVINEYYNKNFNNFINEYRIKEAVYLLSKDEERILTMEGFAETVGFRSKSSFNQAFKNYTGVTPSFFEKNHKKIKI